MPLRFEGEPDQSAIFDRLCSLIPKEHAEEWTCRVRGFLWTKHHVMIIQQAGKTIFECAGSDDEIEGEFTAWLAGRSTGA